MIEAGLDKSKGPVATFIVQNGTLKGGDVVVCGGAYGKVSKLELEKNLGSAFLLRSLFSVFPLRMILRVQ